MVEETSSPAYRQERDLSAAEERYYMASQAQLMWRKFRRHRVATVSLFVLLLLYFVAATYEFWAPYEPLNEHRDNLSQSPTRIHFFDETGAYRGPFVYGMKGEVDFKTFKRVYVEDKTLVYPIHFFVRDDSYKFWGIWRTDLHFFGAGEGKVFLLGTDGLGRDLFSRMLAGARISLSIGLVGVLLSFALGCLLGGISGYLGGTVDIIIQRIVEFLISLPTTPIWMALSAAVPPKWSPVQTYFAITIILSMVGWAGLARVVRGKLLELRENDYVTAAKIASATDLQIIFDHLLPGFTSYLIVHLTLQIPGMILAETALSFLGLGIRAPAVSLGSLMQDAQNAHTLVARPWLLAPGVLVIITVLLYNFLGDGLRDAADPYK
jgi:peptide/nickel transport system permease protein